LSPYSSIFSNKWRDGVSVTKLLCAENTRRNVVKYEICNLAKKMNKQKMEEEDDRFNQLWI